MADFLVEQVVGTRERGHEHTVAQVVAVAKVRFQLGKAVSGRFAGSGIFLVKAAAQ